jgi:DNA-binding transcriptional regulator GbsR (MarR family)
MSNLSESEINQIKKLSSLSTKELGVEIEKNKKEVLVKLNENLNSTNDEELINKINETINKINNSKNSYLTLYTIKDLNKKI